MLLDEPTNHLDLRAKDVLLEAIRDFSGTVLFVSHDLGLVKRLSTRAMLMLDGRVAAYGAPSEVVNRYVGLVLERQGHGEKLEATPGGTFRHGDGASRVVEADLRDARGVSTRSLEPGTPVTIHVRARAAKDVEHRRGSLGVGSVVERQGHPARAGQRPRKVKRPGGGEQLDREYPGQAVDAAPQLARGRPAHRDQRVAPARANVASSGGAVHAPRAIRR